MAHLPGVATPTDIQNVSQVGLRWLKAFPAVQLSAGWIRAVLAPFPNVCFVATGGIDAHNAGEFLDAGARVVAVGSALNDERQLDLLAAIVQPDSGEVRF
jgi:2-keto-3-deoxy-6-phosphogluconate aldolase